MDKKKVLRTIMSLLIVITLTPQIALAHSGRTDSSGGHKDNKNASGLGYYHYHCGGYPPHLHTSGTCPYKSGSASSSTKSSSNTSKNNNSSKDDTDLKMNEAQKNGYDTGYKAGSNGSSYSDSNSSTYSSNYKSGYKSGYEKGKEELESKSKTAYDEGFELGSKGETANNTYDLETIKTSYSNGYEKGLEAYKKENKEKYSKLGEEDAINFTMKEFGDDISDELKEEYKKSYDTKVSELKKIAYNEGYKTAINGKDSDSFDFKHSEERNLYNKGYAEGKTDIEKEIDNAYECGYSEKEYSAPKQLASVEEKLLASFNEGADKLKAEKDSRDKTIKVTTSIVLLGGIAGGVAIKKKKDSSKDDSHKEGF